VNYFVLLLSASRLISSAVSHLIKVAHKLFNLMRNVDCVKGTQEIHKLRILIVKPLGWLHAQRTLRLGFCTFQNTFVRVSTLGL